MPDNTDINGPQDGNTVNQNQDWEMNYWSNLFNVTKDELKDAIGEVGNNASALKNHFGK